MNLTPSLTDEVCRGMISDSNGDIYCVGYTNADLFEKNGGNEDIIALKFSSTGNLIWTKQIGFTTQGENTNIINTAYDDLCLSIAMDSKGNIYCGGETSSSLSSMGNQGGKDAFVLKLSPTGDIVWLNQFGASKNKYVTIS